MSLNQSFISDFSEYSRWSQRNKNANSLDRNAIRIILLDIFWALYMERYQNSSTRYQPFMPSVSLKGYRQTV